MKASLIRLIMGILAFAAIAPASLDAQTSAPPAQAAPLYTAAQLDQLLAPVALYPDQLLGQILMARRPIPSRSSRRRGGSRTPTTPASRVTSWRRRCKTRIGIPA